MDRTNLVEQSEKAFLNLTKPIIFFDLETTGVVPLSDRIIEIYAVKIDLDGTRTELHHVVNPTVPIPSGATEVHGFTDEMVADKPTFKDLCEEIADFFQGSDLGGYNIRRYDVPMLMEEFHRCKKYPINFNEVKLVDAMSIYHSKEKRDLSAAVKFYCEREHNEAHSAKADVLAAMDILKRQLLKYDDLEPNTSFLHDYLRAGNNVDFAGKFVRDDQGKIVFNFGQHKGKEACTKPDYLEWMLDKDFTVDTKMVAKKIYMNCVWEAEIKKWLEQNKVLENPSVATALYTTVKFEEEVFPFSTRKEGEKVVVTYAAEPPVFLTLVHKDFCKILLSLLETALTPDSSHRN